MLKEINLIYLSPWNIGGFATFTSHLYNSLILRNAAVQVLRPLHNKSERCIRHMKHNGFDYRNCTLIEAIKETKKRPTLITSLSPVDALAIPSTIGALMKAGAKIVVHGIQEFKQFPDEIKTIRGDKVVVIRKSMQQYFKGSQYLPHPYVRHFDVAWSPSSWSNVRKRVCTLAMLATLKNPRMLCQANEMLPAKHRIRFLGRETTHFLGLALAKRFPHYEPKPKIPAGTRAELAAKYQLHVDLSAVQGDGGGTQYSFLEAMDAGCANILHDDWIKVAGDMIEDENCVGVSSPEELVQLICKWRPPTRIWQGNAHTLNAHGPHAVVAKLGRIMK